MERAVGGRYRLGRSLGRGSTGEMFVGADTGGQPVTITILPRTLGADARVMGRFLQDQRIVSLSHRNLVPVRDLVVDSSVQAIVMDAIIGPSLRQVLAEAGTLLPAEVARIGAGVAAGLAGLHEAGPVHRVLRPESILLVTSPGAGMAADPMLIDIALWQLLSVSPAGRHILFAAVPEYNAPELADDSAAPTPVSDLYALGALLYELSCGVTPFAGGPTRVVLARHEQLRPGRPSGIADPLWALVDRLLAKQPRHRPASARQVAAELKAMVAELRYAPALPRRDVPPPGRPVRRPDTATSPTAVLGLLGQRTAVPQPTSTVR
jgi:serine/threonine protein kinase